MTGIVGTFQRNQAPMWPDGQPGTLDNNPLGNNPLGNNPLDNNPENNQVWSAKLGRDMRQATDPE